MLRNSQRKKFGRERIKKRRGQVSGRSGVVQELCLITLNRPNLEFKLAKVESLCPSGHEVHSLWDLTSTARV